ncbi:MAG: glucose-6-phosphate isomerase [Buchananella hordeovulneris]|nr:glucose-6-phosphate isomerase [Buchananella hordeovulneris]
MSNEEIQAEAQSCGGCGCGEVETTEDFLEDDDLIVALAGLPFEDEASVEAEEGCGGASDGPTPVLEVMTTGIASAAAYAHVEQLVEDKIASRIAAKDSTIWGEAAQGEASIRLGWTQLHETSRHLVEPIKALRAELLADGIDRVVLAGMGGSSLAPEVIAGTYGVDLVVLDSTDPDQVARGLAGDLARTVLVVSSKSGGTVETDSQRRIFEAAFTAAGLDAAKHIVVVTDPGSPLFHAATEAGYRKIFEADPTVGGRFSALTAFGLVPTGLAGVDVAQLLDDAAAVAPELAEDCLANPALILGAAIAGTQPLRDKLVLADDGSGLFHFGDWAEQLVAESTGKDGVGLLPVVATLEAPELAEEPGDVLPVYLFNLDADEVLLRSDSVHVAGRLGAAMLLWEYATAVAGVLLGINPFDQPNVESAKAAARELLENTPEPEPATFVEDGIEVRASAGLLDGVTTVAGALEALYATLDADKGYLAVMAYLDREGAPAGVLAPVRDALARRLSRPVTFGWGPRFLHSTGQLHKGGFPIGAFLQITGDAQAQLDIPGREFDLATLIGAQAAGDAAVLAAHQRPVVRLHVKDGAALERLAALLSA